MACDPAGCFRSSIDEHVLLRLLFVPMSRPAHADCMVARGWDVLDASRDLTWRHCFQSCQIPTEMMRAYPDGDEAKEGRRRACPGSGGGLSPWTGGQLTPGITGGSQAQTSRTSPPPTPNSPRGLGMSGPPANLSTTPAKSRRLFPHRYLGSSPLSS